MADANKHAERTTNFTREMMNLPFLKTNETTSVNTDETRHPSVKKSPPTRKQASIGNVIHHTHLTHQPWHQQFGLYRTRIWTKVQNRTTAHYASREDTSWTKKATTQHCTCWEHAPRHWLQNNECWRMEDHTPSSAPCSHDSQTSFNYGQSIIVPHQRQTSSSTDIPTPRAPQRFITNFHIFETTHVGNMWNSGWNSTLTLIHRCPDSIVLQPHPPQTQIIQCSCSNTTTILNNANMTRIDRATKHPEHRIHPQESQ